MAKRAGCGNEGADKRHCADTCAGAGCGAAVNLPDTAMCVGGTAWRVRVRVRRPRLLAHPAQQHGSSLSRRGPRCRASCGRAAQAHAAALCMRLPPPPPGSPRARQGWRRRGLSWSWPAGACCAAAVLRSICWAPSRTCQPAPCAASSMAMPRSTASYERRAGRVVAAPWRQCAWRSGPPVAPTTPCEPLRVLRACGARVAQRRVSC